MSTTVSEPVGRDRKADRLRAHHLKLKDRDQFRTINYEGVSHLETAKPESSYRRRTRAPSDTLRDRAAPLLERASKETSTLQPRMKKHSTTSHISTTAFEDRGIHATPPLDRIDEGRPSKYNERRGRPASSAIRIGFRANSSSLDRHASSSRDHRSQGQLQERVQSLLTSPSSLSLVSGLTGASSSSGSTSTITQRSYLHEQRSTTRPLSRSSTTSTMEGSERRQHRRKKRHVETFNVFNFLEKESPEDVIDNAWRSSSEDEEQKSRAAYDASLSATESSASSPDVSRRTSRVQSWHVPETVHSDSGISMNDSIPDHATSLTKVERKPPAPDPQDFMLHPGTQAYSDGEEEEGQERSEGEDYAEPSYDPYTPHAYAHPSQAIPYHVSYAAHEMSAISGCDVKVRPPETGYELIAAKLCAHHEASHVTAVYRKFEHLDHRILLHLQDELSELDEQLQVIDGCIAGMNKSSEIQIKPTSRRMDARYGTELHYQQTELLGRIAMKKDHYNRALSSLADLKTKHTSGEQEDIDVYKTWLSEKKPIVEFETRFLNHTHDLVKVGASSATSQQVEGKHDITIAIFAFLFGFLCLAISLSFVTDLAGRVILAVTFAGAVATAMKIAHITV